MYRLGLLDLIDNKKFCTSTLEIILYEKRTPSGLLVGRRGIS